MPEKYTNNVTLGLSHHYEVLQDPSWWSAA